MVYLKKWGGRTMSSEDCSIYSQPERAKESPTVPGFKMGEGAVIGAHSLVLSNIPPWTIAAGTPAKPIKKRPRLEIQFS